MITEYSESRKTLTKLELCEALGVTRSSYYRVSSSKLKSKPLKKPSARKLSEDEEDKILAIVNSDRFCDMAPGEIFFTLLDEGQYYCSERTIYRILQRNQQNVQRRQKTAGNYDRPELLATKPNEVWSWDITKLKRLFFMVQQSTQTFRNCYVNTRDDALQISR